MEPSIQKCQRQCSGFPFAFLSILFWDSADGTQALNKQVKCSVTEQDPQHGSISAWVSAYIKLFHVG